MSLVKKNGGLAQSSFTRLGTKLVGKPTTVEQRLKEFQARQQDISTLPNRLVLSLDCSGSMLELATSTQSKFDLLKEAVCEFSRQAELGSSTAIAVTTIPYEYETEKDFTTDPYQIETYVMGLDVKGSTPMKRALLEILNRLSCTRVVLVSDGEPTDWHEVVYQTDTQEEKKRAIKETLGGYIKLSIPIDCIHIGKDTKGEDLLKLVAEVTGGIYVKFKDVERLMTGLSYLTPAKRLLLTSGQLNTALLGADEVKL
jgi:Mg-chelatase subunit ChlD